MKKILVSALSLLASLCAFAGSQGEDNGLDLKLSAGFHGDKFGYSDVDLAKYGFLKGDYPFKNATPTFGFSLDSRWYLVNPGDAGIAIDVRWVDFAFANCKSEVNLKYEKPTNISSVTLELDYTATTKTQFYDLSICGVGPMGTYYFNSKNAVDLYYNIMPNIFLISMKRPEYSSDSDMFMDYYKEILDENSDDRTNTFAFGVSHRIGAAYRHKLFQAGVELKFGKLKYQDWGNDRNNEKNELDMMFKALSADKIKAGAFRVFVGFKF
ncbi:MAG: hypothetical protein MJZ14_07295 [Paludibacteraceae bacterium]|nr:hypothetical protein [Paludibacteraceae bacterium]